VGTAGVERDGDVHPRELDADLNQDLLMEWVGLPFVQGGFMLVVIAFVLAMLTGRLLPKSYVEDLREGDKLTIERQREEITEWRTAWIAADLSKRELVSHMGDLMETGKVTAEALRSIAKDSS
jgi:hypothetical protein